MTPKEKVLRRYPKAFAVYGRVHSKRGLRDKVWKIWRPGVLTDEPLSPGAHAARTAWWLAASLICAGLSGCASQAQIPKEVLVPVATPCITDPVERPAFVTDAELAAADDYGFVLRLASDRLARAQYEVRLEALVEGCR